MAHSEVRQVGNIEYAPPRIYHMYSNIHNCHSYHYNAFIRSYQAVNLLYSEINLWTASYFENCQVKYGSPLGCRSLKAIADKRWILYMYVFVTAVYGLLLWLLSFFFKYVNDIMLKEDISCKGPKVLYTVFWSHK